MECELTAAETGVECGGRSGTATANCDCDCDCDRTSAKSKLRERMTKTEMREPVRSAKMNADECGLQKPKAVTSTETSRG